MTRSSHFAFGKSYTAGELFRVSARISGEPFTLPPCLMGHFPANAFVRDRCFKFGPIIPLNKYLRCYSLGEVHDGLDLTDGGSVLIKQARYASDDTFSHSQMGCQVDT